MCGLGGILNWDGRGVAPKRIAALEKALQHRGRTESGRYSDSFVGLVCARYGVIAPHSGHQPARSRNQRGGVVCKGLIYNYGVLGAKISNESGLSLESGDIDVACALFERFGWPALEELRGPFAIAAWDNQKKELWLARDRLGEK